MSIMVFEKYGQYKRDVFNKLCFSFEQGRNLLDIGCGDGSDAELLINEYKLNVYGVDVYTHENVKNVEGLRFVKATIYSLPFKTNFFDYVFLHDVLHHISDRSDSKSHKQAFREIKRVTKKGGSIIIIEGNRYNPLFYFHMVKKLGHDHWTHKYFVNIIKKSFKNVTFKFFEAHYYPEKLLPLFKAYECLMETFSPKRFLSYNVAVISNE